MSTVSTISEIVAEMSDGNEDLTGTFQNPLFQHDEGDCSPNDRWIEIIPSCLQKLSICLGKGHTGIVYLGCWLKGPNNEKEIVAIKMPKSDDVSEEALEIERKTIRDEIKTLAYIGKHENVLQLKGAVTLSNDQLWMALEYCELGNLRKFLMEKRELFRDEIFEHACESSGTIYKMQNDHDCSSYWNGRNGGFVSTIDLLSFALQIANGMSFLHERRIVHRDLALRNCLLTVDYKIKIADFGLSRKTRNGYYTRTMLINQAIPYLWTAPEAITSPKVLLESDWWTFGVVLWELFGLGTTPYAGATGTDILGFLEQGRRLEKPRFCPAEIYTMMSSLWSIDPHQRMSLSDCKVIISAQLALAAGPELLDQQSGIYEPALIATLNQAFRSSPQFSAVRRTTMMNECESNGEFGSKKTLLPSSKCARIFLLAAFSVLILVILAMGTLLYVQLSKAKDENGMSPPSMQSCEATVANGTTRSWNGHEYMYISTKLAWKESEQVCAKWGGHLTSIHSDEENKFVFNMHSNCWAWLGLNDIEKEGTFVWSDGTSNKTFPHKFYPDEPNNANGNEDCVVQRPTLSDWSDDQCYNISPFVCKKVIA